MLDLANNIAGHDFRIGRTIGNHQNLGRTRKQIDSHAAVENSFGLRDKPVARADNDIGLVSGE